MNIKEMQQRKIELGYSNAQIAQLSGVPLGTVQKIFAGTTTHPRFRTIQALTKLFQDTPDPSKDTAEDSANWGGAAHTGTSQTDDAVSNTRSSASEVREEAFAYGTKKQGEYTLEDYYALPEDRRVELIDGVIYDMTAPTRTHQCLIGEIFGMLRAYIRGKGGSCMPFMAPVDVRLDRDDKTMVQPDVLVICPENLHQSDGRRIEGAPDFVCEILSPSTRRKDLITKLAKYSNAGVREYWIVDPDTKKVIVYDFEGDSVIPAMYTFADRVPVAIFGGQCLIDFADIAQYMEERKSLLE